MHSHEHISPASRQDRIQELGLAPVEKVAVLQGLLIEVPESSKHIEK
jgi:hypothetical protein